MKFNIGTKILGSFLAILLLVVIIGFYTLSVNQNALEEAVGQGSVFLVEDTIQRIDKDLFLKIEQLAQFASDPILQDTLRQSNNFFAALVDPDTLIQERDASWRAAPLDTSTVLIDEITENLLSDRLRKVFIQFSETRYGYPSYSKVFVTNSYGVNVGQTGRTSDYYQADELWWQNTRKSGFDVGGFEFDNSAATLGMLLSVSVLGEDGTFLGVIKAVFPASILVREAELTGKKYGTSEVTLLTNASEIIYKTGAFQFFKNISDEPFLGNIDEGSGFFVAEGSGRERLFSYAHSQGFGNYAGLGWILLISHDTEEVFAPVRALRNFLLGITGVLVLVIVILAFILSRSISHPIKKLTETARKIAGGDLDKRAKVTSKDEIGILAGAFNDMTGKLQKSYAKLQQQITELKELDRLKDNFLNNTTHELKTPLIPIKSQAQILLLEAHGVLNAKQKKSVEMILKNETHLEDLVTDVMDISKLHSNKMTFSFKPADLKPIIEEAVRDMEELSKERGITLILKSVPELPKLQLDTKRIIQVIDNLLNNSLKFTGEGGTVTVKVTKNEKKLFTINRLQFQERGLLPNLLDYR